MIIKTLIVIIILLLILKILKTVQPYDSKFGSTSVAVYVVEN